MGLKQNKYRNPRERQYSTTSIVSKNFQQLHVAIGIDVVVVVVAAVIVDVFVLCVVARTSNRLLCCCSTICSLFPEPSLLYCCST